MVSLRALALLLAAVPNLSLGDSTMTCGTGVPLCGVLTLQTGLGSGVYQSKAAKVHGLWPETGNYGTSKCIKPKNTADPTKVYDCYSEDSDQQTKSFETHEWEKHGECAGVVDVDDFFGQVCAISKAPLAVLETAKEANKNFAAMAQALKDSNYPVWSLDSTYDQILLSACAGDDGKWVLAQVADFPAKCGGSSPGPSPPSPPSPPVPTPAPNPTPSGGSCSPGKKGPACKQDADCSGVSGCVRCAHSGFCTDQKMPAPSSDKAVRWV